MEVDRQFFRCWGCPSSQPSPTTVFHSSNGYYGYLPRNVSSDSTNQQVPDGEQIRSILAGRKRTYNEMCSGVNYRALDNHKSCKFKVNKVEESNNTGMVLG